MPRMTGPDPPPEEAAMPKAVDASLMYLPPLATSCDAAIPKIVSTHFKTPISDLEMTSKVGLRKGVCSKKT